MTTSARLAPMAHGEVDRHRKHQDDGSVTAARKGAFQQRRMKSLSTPNKKHNLQVRYARTSVCCRQSRTARSIRWREMVDKHKHDNVSLRRRPSAITLQHLRYVVAAADRGSFRQAAEALFLKQSTLSRAIRQLEETLRINVFERSSGGVKATTAGQCEPAGVRRRSVR